MKKLARGAEVRLAVTLGLGVSLTMGCSNSADTLGEGRGGTRSLNVGQGGAQDIGYFRSIVEAGGVPRPETLDPVGFFAEHAVDLPEATCGEVVCVHPSLAVAPRFDGSNWTMAYLGMNTSIDPASLPRPPVHLVLAVDTSASTSMLRADLVEAVRGMLATMRPEDRVSLVRIGAVADRLLGPVAPADRALGASLTATSRGITVR